METVCKQKLALSIQISISYYVAYEIHVIDFHHLGEEYTRHKVDTIANMVTKRRLLDEL